MPDPIKPKVYYNLQDYNRAKTAFEDSTTLYKSDLLRNTIIHNDVELAEYNTAFNNLNPYAALERLTLLNNEPPSRINNGIQDRYKKPVQPVVYSPPSYQQIPTKQPNLQSSLITDEQLTPTYIKPITKYPQSISEFTSKGYPMIDTKRTGNNIVPQGEFNYGDNKGRKEFDNGGVRDGDPTPKGNSTSVNNLGFLPDNYLNDIINKDLLIQENNRLASNYVKANPDSVIKQPINTDKIDYPNTDKRSSNYVGNPNWSFAAPNMTGKQRADAEAYHGDIIGSELAGIGIMKGISSIADKAKSLRFTTDPNKYYRAVGPDAAEDFINNNIVRSKVSNPNTVNKVGQGTINLGNRPTAYPSFSKGEISKEYVKGLPKHYVIETDRAMKASTLGRHGKGSTIFPVDDSGNYLKEFSSNEARLLKPHWLKGYTEVPKKEIPTFANGGIHNLNRSNISETFDEMFVNKYK